MKLRSFAVALLLGLCACSSIVHESKQNVMINSNPQGATLTIDGQRYTTPAMVPLKGKSEYHYTVEKDGYKPATGKVDGEFRIWSTVVGNIFNLTSFIGFATDYWGTQTAYELQKDNVISLEPLPPVAAPAPQAQQQPLLVPSAQPQPTYTPYYSQQPAYGQPQAVPPMAAPRYMPYPPAR